MQVGRTALVAVLTAAALTGGCAATEEADEGLPGDDVAGDTASEDVADAQPADDGDTAVPGELPDPCGLLTQQEVADATGLPFGPGARNAQLSSDDQVVCDWISEDPFATAQVMVTPHGDRFEDQRASVEEAFGEPAVSLDLADAAYRTAEGSIVAMQVGDLFVQVSHIPNGPGEVTDITLELARAVLSRL